MYTSKSYFYSIAIILVVSLNQSFAQPGVIKDAVLKKKQSVVIYLGGGFANYVSGISTLANLQGNISKNSPYGTVRAMWHPGFRLNLGVQSGYTNFYSYHVKNNNVAGKVRVSAVPILAMWSMPIFKRLNIFAGFGSYLLTTHLDYEEIVKSNTFSLGSNIALSYIHPITKNIGIGTEAEWMSAFETRDNLLALKIHFTWRAFEF